MLAGGIDRSPRRPCMPKCGGYVHDAAVFLWQHHAKFVFHAQQRAEHVSIERSGVAVRSLLRYRAWHAFRTGSVHSDIQTAKSFHGLVDQVSYVFFVAHIGTDEFRFGTCLADFTDDLLALFVAPTGNNNLRAFLGKSEGRSPSDSCQPSCNQNNLGIHWISPFKISPPNSGSEP